MLLGPVLELFLGFLIVHQLQNVLRGGAVGGTYRLFPYLTKLRGWVT